MKKIQLLIILLIGIFLFAATKSIAQEKAEKNKLSIKLNADITSNFAWRGMAITSAPTFIPALSIMKGGFSFGIFGIVDMNGYEELDLELSYKIKDFKLTFTDYYAAPDKFFEYKKESTKHLLELGFTYANENFPIQFYAGTMVYGEDKHFFYNELESDLIRHNYSTYFELKYSFEFKTVAMDIFSGGTPFTGLYGNDFAFVNMGLSASKSIKFSDRFSMPLYASFAMNPQKERFLVYLGIHI